MDSTKFYDIWKDGPATRSKTSLDPELEDYYLKQVKKKQPRKFIPKSKKTVDIRAVEPPPPGSSYNPALDDHLVLLMQAAEAEKKKLKKEERIERLLKLPPAEELVTPEIKLKESREGLDPANSDDEQDNETEMTENSYRPAVPTISAENRKLSSARKREKLRKHQEKERRKQNVERIRQSEIYRLRSIKKDIKQQEEERTKKKEQRKKRLEKLAKIRPPKLSAVPYEPAEAELQLSSELCGSLLELKPEGSLLEDRYKSLQKRGVVEPRIKQNHRRKYRLKKYEKRSHRDMPDDYLPR